MWIICWQQIIHKKNQSKWGCKDQESIQSSTTPDPGYQWESDKLTADTSYESQEVSPFPAGDHKAHINRRAQRQALFSTNMTKITLWFPLQSDLCALMVIFSAGQGFSGQFVKVPFLGFAPFCVSFFFSRFMAYSVLLIQAFSWTTALHEGLNGVPLKSVISKI